LALELVLNLRFFDKFICLISSLIFFWGFQSIVLSLTITHLLCHRINWRFFIVAWIRQKVIASPIVYTWRRLYFLFFVVLICLFVIRLLFYWKIIGWTCIFQNHYCRFIRNDFIFELRMLFLLKPNYSFRHFLHHFSKIWHLTCLIHNRNRSSRRVPNTRSRNTFSLLNLSISNLQRILIRLWIEIILVLNVFDSAIFWLLLNQ
jgi:hypothetical protein